MRKWAVAAALLLAASAAAWAQADATYESITVANTAIGLTATTTNPTGGFQMGRCQARLETAQVRFRFDGTAPTSSEGTLLEVGDVLSLDTIETARRVQFIRTGGTSGVLKVHCWR